MDALLQMHRIFCGILPRGLIVAVSVSEKAFRELRVPLCGGRERKKQNTVEIKTQKMKFVRDEENLLCFLFPGNLVEFSWK